jgi:P-type Cu2+ transporter
VKHDLPEPTLRDRDEQTRPDRSHVGHQHEQQPNPASHSSHEHAGHDKHAGHSPAMFQRRFFICLLLTLPVLYLTPMFQMWFHYQAIQFAGVAWVTPILATVIYWYGGWVFLHRAWAELHSKIGMMTLVALAITVSYVYSLAVSFGLSGDSFYMELVTLVDIMLLGHWIEMTSVQGASRALEHLAKLVPAIAHQQVNGRLEDVQVSALVEGERILIRPGEQVPIDGEVIEGTSSVNEAFLTGESHPVVKKTKDEVVAGAVNGEGALTIKVIRTGDKTTLSQIMRSGLQASESRGESAIVLMDDKQVDLWISRPNPPICTRSSSQITANGRAGGDDYRRCRSSGKNRCGGFEDRSLLRSCLTAR